MSCIRSTRSRVRSLTEMFRFFPATGTADIYPWMRTLVIDAGLDPDRCALATLDSLGWREEATADGLVRILRKRGVILADDERAFSFTVITGGGGRWELRDDRISEMQPLALDDRTVWKEELAEAARLLRGEVFFPPALFSVAYPPRDGAVPWGAILVATTSDRVVRTAFRRDGTVDPSAYLEPGSGRSYRIPEWIEDSSAFAAEQARREKPLAQFRCPCCGYLTLMERATAYETCPVCRWIDDGQDDPHADERWGGPNGSLTLTEARANVRRLGAVEERLVRHARPPMPEEL